MRQERIIAIVGPTACGKSTLAIDAAERLNTEIISCDSMQVYKSLDIGTAKVSPIEMQRVKHHMIDVVDSSREFSAGEYAAAVKPIITALNAKDKIPIVAGGTGLYLDGLLRPMSFGGVRDEAMRASLKDELAERGAAAMYEELEALDPDDAKLIHPNNTVRVLRALEIYRVCGKTKSQMGEAQMPSKYRYAMVVLYASRRRLCERIDARVEKMFDSGLEAEVERISNGGTDWSLPCLKAIGYKEFKPYFALETSLEEVKSNIKQASRNYAKRQLTWFKRYKDAKWFDIGDVDAALDYITEVYNEFQR